jgi:biotin synthase
MGETWQDRLDMALLLSEMNITSIPLNFLIPVKGTPLGQRPRLSPDEITRIVAVFRYINPTAFIRIAAGRSYFNDGGAVLFRSGANATLTGDMLTTVGNNTLQDREMLLSMGFQLKSLPGRIQ